MSELRGCHLHVDCAAGAAGDMLLGALLDLGVPAAVVEEALDRLGYGDRLEVSTVVKGGLRAVDVKVRLDDSGATAAGAARGDEHPHHHYRDIRARVVGAGLGEAVTALALDIFDRVARAEARLHGTTVDDVAFHEVGAVDSIVDIVGNAAALAWLAPRAVTCTGVAMGHGTIRCAHGVLPVPAPAALEILRESAGVMVDGGVARELCTPTGAAVLSAAVTEWAPMPALRALAVGYGAGDADLEDRANVVRVVVGQPAAAAATDRVLRLEANVDDMSPELCDHATAALFEAGALDVWWTPITMKKGRPALLLSALAPESAREAVVSATVRETTTIGVRYDLVARRVLERELREVDTRYGPIPIKVALLDGRVTNVAPEYEACRAAARRHGAPLKAVFAAAVAAFGASASD